MSSGEALWNVYALLVALERRLGADPDILKALGSGQSDCRVLAETLMIRLPDPQQLELRVAKIVPEPTNPFAKEAIDCCDFLDAHIVEACELWTKSVVNTAISMKSDIRRYNDVSATLLSKLRGMKDALTAHIAKGPPPDENRDKLLQDVWRTG